MTQCKCWRHRLNIARPSPRVNRSCTVKHSWLLISSCSSPVGNTGSLDQSSILDGNTNTNNYAAGSPLFWSTGGLVPLVEAGVAPAPPLWLEALDIQFLPLLSGIVNHAPVPFWWNIQFLALLTLAGIPGFAPAHSGQDPWTRLVDPYVRALDLLVPSNWKPWIHPYTLCEGLFTSPYLLKAQNPWLYSLTWIPGPAWPTRVHSEWDPETQPKTCSCLLSVLYLNPPLLLRYHRILDPSVILEQAPAVLTGNPKYAPNPYDLPRITWQHRCPDTWIPGPTTAYKHYPDTNMSGSLSAFIYASMSLTYKRLTFESHSFWVKISRHLHCDVTCELWNMYKVKYA